MQRSRAVNRLLLGSSTLRPVYLALWVPNGLVVGCEALIVPYAGRAAGYLFAATAVGMLAGDVLMGRVVPPHLRDRLVEPARLLLAVPWLAFFLQPSSPGLRARGGRLGRLLRQPAAAGAAGDPHLGRHPGPRARAPRTRHDGDAGRRRLLAGTVATLLGSDAHAAGMATGLMAAASVVVTLALVPGLRRSRQHVPVEVLTLASSR